VGGKPEPREKHWESSLDQITRLDVGDLLAEALLGFAQITLQLDAYPVTFR
jgi:hypothetical protein